MGKQKGVPCDPEKCNLGIRSSRGTASIWCYTHERDYASPSVIGYLDKFATPDIDKLIDEAVKRGAKIIFATDCAEGTPHQSNTKQEADHE